MPKFVIILKNEKMKTYAIIGWLIIGLNLIGLLYIGISSYNGIMAIPFYAASLLIIIFLFRLISGNRESVESDTLGLSFSVAIIAWVVLQLYWLAVVMFFLFLFEDISRRKLAVLFYDDRIIYPSFPKKIIEWKELNNVVLKDGLLTIDLKNNKLFQNEILSPGSELDLNEFCEAHINACKN